MTSTLAWLSVLVALATLGPHFANAISASPNPIFEVLGEEGFKLELRVHGGEDFQWTTDSEGNPVMWNADLKDYVYVSRVDESGKFVPTEYLAGRSAGRDPAEFLGKEDIHQLQQTLNITETRTIPRARAFSSARDAPLKREGDVRNLVLLMRFSDHAGRELTSRDLIDTIMNGFGPSVPRNESRRYPIVTGSVHDYFHVNSYGKVNVTSTVLDWATVSMTEAQVAASCAALCGESPLVEAVREALGAAVADGLDLADFDGNNDGYVDLLTVIHSGHGAEHGGLDDFANPQESRIWSHRRPFSTAPFVSGSTAADQLVVSPAFHYSKGPDVLRIGVLVHELSHQFGLPDLYDTDGSSSGIGGHGLMAFAWGALGDQYHPPPVSAWSKMMLGWAEPVTIESSGTYSLAHAERSPVVYVIEHGFESKMEYLILEHRDQGITRDWYDFHLYRQGGGLLVYHVDEAKANNRQEGVPGAASWPQDHFRVAITQADGEFLLERASRDNGGTADLLRGGMHLADDSWPSINAYGRLGCGATGTRIEMQSDPLDNNLTVAVTLAASEGACCADRKNWMFEREFGCDWFREQPARCASSAFGAVEGREGYIAQEACCACGGGEVARATPSPFALPWEEPLEVPTQPPQYVPATQQPASSPDDNMLVVFGAGFGAVAVVAATVMVVLVARGSAIKQRRREAAALAAVAGGAGEEWDNTTTFRDLEQSNPMWLPDGVPVETTTKSKSEDR